ncbi:hypothetical protein F5878DRAFT_659381 [Lentinula raphanica]|uniref:Uncharacterized protein n=1 Tax=Lentinula raphanica TaxID=153919 RepID=A0AA38UGP2_9AGAR|nr:hypothetical protein F5878DRAFT_659381 [Lentinula raphanica]
MYISRWPIYLSFLAAIPTSVLGIPTHHPTNLYRTQGLAIIVFKEFNTLESSLEPGASISAENSHAILELARHLVSLAHQLQHHSSRDVHGIQIWAQNYPEAKQGQTVYDFTVTGGPVCGQMGCVGQIELGDRGEAAQSSIYQS